MTRTHLYLTAFWALMIVPTLLWWRESVLWVALMSIYAIVVSHWSAYQAAHAESQVSKRLADSMECIDRKMDEQRDRSGQGGVLP